MARFVKISVLSMSRIWQGEHAKSNGEEADFQSMLAHIQQQLEYVLPDQPDLIVFPEACDRFMFHSLEQRQSYYQVRGNRIRDYLCQVAREHRCYIAYSAHRYVPEDKELPYRNSTQLINRKGEVEAVYDKNHLVPSELENGKIRYGTEAPVFELDFGRVACAICFDLNFDELMYRYAEQKPELIVFSSMYHGGFVQQSWAYNCRAFFAGAIYGKQSRILNPFGETLASTTEYYPFVTATVNLDYALVHIDRNDAKYRAAKKKYGEKLTVHDPGGIGAVMLSYAGEDTTAWDIVREFDILPLDDYFNACRAHRNAHT